MRAEVWYRPRKGLRSDTAIMVDAPFSTLVDLANGIESRNTKALRSKIKEALEDAKDSTDG